MESARLRFAEKSRGYAQLKEGAQAREEGLVRKEEAHAREESVVRKEEDAQAREESFVVKVADIAESRNSRISRASMRWGKVRNDMWTKAGGDPREYWAADTIQRLYMRHRIVFSLFGSTLFSRKNGSPADYGELYFPTTNSTAPFITVSDTTSASMLGSYMELTWKLRRPEVLISVTGGAQDFSLPPNLQRAFDRGLASAASSTNAWVFTGGTHTGVMKLVAAAFSEYSVQVPLIAVVPLGCVNGRDAFEGARKASCPYLACGEKPSATGAPLNPSHTHFVLVDDGKVAPAAWGGEIGLRSSLESTYAQDKAVPLVLVVVQGGPGTLNMVLAYAKNGQAILLVRDSGGAADAVADVVLTGHTDDPKFQSEGSQRTLGQIHRLHRQSGGLLITCYSLSDVNDQGHQVEMSTMLLKALIKNLRPSSRRLAAAHKQPPALQESLSRSSISLDGSVKKRSSEEELGRALVLAVNWNRVDIAEGLVNDLSEAAAINPQVKTLGKFSFGHHVALQFIIEKQRVELFRLISHAPDFTVAGVNLSRLYYYAEDKYAIISSDSALKQRMSTQLKVISGQAQAAPSGEPLSTYAVYQAVIGPFIASLIPELEPVLAASRAVSFRDLFLWSVLVGQDELMHEFWKRSESPLRVALMGARLARVMTSRMQFGKAECFTRADVLESWAVGTLEAVPTMATAKWILGHSPPEWSGTSLLDVAMQFEMKTFVAQRQCQALMDSWWLGGFTDSTLQLPEDHSMLTLWIYTLMPAVNPYLWTSSDGREGDNDMIRTMDGVAAALMFAAKLARQEQDVVAGYRPSLQTASEEVQAKGDAAVQEAAALHEQSRLIAFYRVPAVKLIVRLSMHFLMLASYFQVLTTSEPSEEVAANGVPRVEWHELFFFLLVVSNFLDQAHQQMQLRRLRVTITQPFGTLLTLGDRVLLVVIMMRIVSACGGLLPRLVCERSYNVYQLLLSLDVIILSLRTINFRSASMDFGVLVIMIENMVGDLVLFLELFVLVSVGFMGAFVGLTPWGDDHWEAYGVSGDTAGRSLKGSLTSHASHNVERGPWYSLTVMFWGIFGEFDLGFYEEHVPFGPPVLFVYLTTASIVLVNLLVAMFADTYATIKANSELEFRFQKYNRIFLYQRIVHPVPQVFNLPLIVPELVADWTSEWRGKILPQAARCGACRKAGIDCFNSSIGRLGHLGRLGRLGRLADCACDCFGEDAEAVAAHLEASEDPVGPEQPPARRSRIHSKDGPEPSKAADAAAAAERVHMETYLATRLEEERRTVKGIATATHDAVNGLAADQSRAFDLLHDINRTLETAVLAHRQETHSPAAPKARASEGVSA